MENILKQLKDNWFIMAFMVSITLWYGSTNSRLTAVEAQQAEQSTVQEKVDALIVDVAVIKSETKESGKKIDSLGGKVDYIINELRKID